MRISGFLTGSSGLGALALSDLDAPAFYCWTLLVLAFVGLAFLSVTTVRPDWTRAIHHRLDLAWYHALRRVHPTS